MTSVVRQGGVSDSSNYLKIFMIGDSTVTGDLSLTYYIGREVDTGPGETGHGAYFKVDGGVITQEWRETGLPPDTGFTSPTQSTQRSLIAALDKTSGGAARVGAYRMSVDYKGWTERNVLLNEFRGGIIIIIIHLIYKAPNPLDSQMLKAQLVQKMKYIHDTFIQSAIGKVQT